MSFSITFFLRKNKKKITKPLSPHLSLFFPYSTNLSLHNPTPFTLSFTQSWTKTKSPNAKTPRPCLFEQLDRFNLRERNL